MAVQEILTVLFGLLCLGLAAKCPKQKTSPGREVLCYTSTFDVERLADSICRCTSLVHQGHDVRNLTTSGIKSFQESLKEMNPAVQLVISVDDPAGTLKTSATIRQEAIARLMRIIKEVDGLELNVTAGSKERLFHFVKGLKDEIERKSYNKRIFVALPTIPEDLAKQFDLKELSKYVDLFTVATHYLVDEDEAYYTFHPSRLMGLFDMLNTDSLVDLISGLGAPKRKILVTVPASVYKFTLKDANDTTPRSPTVEKKPVVIDRKELCESMNKGEWTVERDEDLTAPYSFSNTTWIAFEDKVSAGIKGKYVLVRDLAGLGVRDIENDMETNCEKPLTYEIHHSFMDLKRKSRGAVLSSLEEDIHQARINYPSQIKSSGYRVVRVVDTEGHIRAIRENTQTEFTCNRQGYFVHPKSCNRFYRCVKFNQGVEDYSVFEFDCPAGLAFDERTEVCVWPGSLPQGSACPGSSEIPPVARVRFECPAQPGYYADPQNCRWFFACIDLGGAELMAFEFRCPYGLVFDEHKLVCEWPWLVPSCSDSGSNYARTEYNVGPYNVGSTSQGVGTYVTGGLPVGYSGSTGTGYHGTSGVKYSGSTAGGYSRATTAGGIGGYSTAGGEYAGSTRGGYSHSTQTTSGSYSGGRGGYSTSGGEYSGFTGSSAGATVKGYSGGSTGYSGGSSYTGSTAGSSVHVGGTGGSHIGGTQFTGSIGGGSIGAGSTYSGSTGGGHIGGTQFGGSTGGGTTYSGSTGGGHIGGTQFGGSTGDGSAYSGSTGGGHIGGTQFAGSTGAGSIGGSIGTGSTYTGSTGEGHIGGTQFGGSTGGGSTYSGSTGGGHIGGTQFVGSTDGGSAYSGSTSGGHIGGTQFAGSTGAGSIGGSIGTGSTYTGSTGESHIGGTQFSGSTGGGSTYTGSTGGSHIGGSQFGSSTGAGSTYTGTAGGVYSSSTAGSSAGSFSGSGYTGSTSGVYSGTVAIGGHVGSTEYSGSTGSGYSGSTVPGYQGSTGIHIGDTTGFAGSTSDAGLSSGIDYSGGSGGISYTGSTGGIYTQGATGASGGYVGSIGSTVGLSGSSGAGYSGTVDKKGSVGTTQVTTGLSKEGYGRPDYSVSSTLGYGGSTKSGVAGSSVSGTSYVGGSTSGTNYVGGSGVTTGYLSPGVSGSGVTGVSDEQTIISGDGQYSGTAGSRRPGYTVSIGAGQTSKPIYPSTGTIGSGTIGSGVSETKGTGFSSGIGGSSYGTVITTGRETPGVTLVDQAPSLSYIPGSKIPGSTGTTSPLFTKYQPPPPGSFSTSNRPSVPTTYISGSTTGYDLGSTTGKGITSGTTYYGSTGFSHGYGTGSITGKPSLNVTIIGSGIPSTTYGAPGVYGTVGETAGTGTIITGNTVQGTILTDDSSSGTVISHGHIPGSITIGSSDQGTILTGVSQPGFVKTETGTPGYVVSDGVKTVYPGSASPGVTVHGISSPGVLLTGPSVPGTIIKGESTPGLVLTGQTSPGVSLGGSVEQGTVVGGSTGSFFTDSASTTYHGGSRPSGVPGLSTGSQDTGYKTTEYYDNGGRGTIRFNNGYTSTKYGETDIPDYRTSSGILPEIFGPGVARINDTGRISFGTTLSGQTQTDETSSGYSSTRTGFTPSGFTKTGPTRTGITTASLGGKGSYITGSGQRPKGPPQNIGEKAFDGTAGYTKSLEGSIGTNQFAGVSSTVAPGVFSTTEAPDISHIDTSKITLGPALSSSYSFDQSRTQFGSGVVTGSTSTPISPTEKGVFTATTPTPYLNVEIYNTPDVGAETYPEYGGKGVTTIGYATGPLEGYKTTVLGAAGVPVTASTVRPVIDTGYKTVVSSTSIPVSLSGDGFTPVGGGFQTGSVGTQNFETETYQHSGFGQREHISMTTPSTPTVSIASGYSSTRFRQPGVSVTTESYERPGVTKPRVQYLPSSTVSPISSTSEYYKTSKTSFGHGSASSTVEGEQSSKVQEPEIQYLPSTTITPPIGVTYSKPFTAPGITYGQPTSTPSTGGSPTRIGISRDEVEKLITNYDRGTVKYTPSIYDTYTGTDYTGTTESIGYSRKQSSSPSSSSSSSSSFSSGGSGIYLGSTTTSIESGKTAEPLTITTYSGGYNKPSTSYELSTKSTPGKGKVIVKWSDLHPLLLGKLGAECTCKADPFATLRGPGKKLIASSKGQVDLNNYDESDVYVDLETDYGSKEYVADRVISDDSTSPTPFKITPLIGGSTVKPVNTYLPSWTTASQQTVGRAKNSERASYGNSVSFTADNVGNPSIAYSSSVRSGKKLHSGAESLMNVIASEGATFGGLEIGSLPGAEEVLDGTNECARSGLFRHPNFCNKFYACHWDEWKKKFTLHVFNCPVHLTFDSTAGACNWPSKGPACQGDNLLV